MRTFYTLLFLLAALLGKAQTVYVDADASGAADGTSWANAYTDLADALANAAADSDIWIAEGTYLPGSGETFDTLFFTIDRPLNLYGGFDGTETSVDQADPANHASILSGDFNQDDITDEFNINKEDNARKILNIDTLAATTLDGLKFSGADGTLDTDVFGFFWSLGAAVYSDSPLSVNNCRFTDNRAWWGASVCVFGGAGGSTFTNSSFTNNLSGNRAAGVYMEQIEEVSFNNCNFSNNAAIRGGIYGLRVVNCTVNDCLFDNNNGGGFNAGLYSWNGTNWQVTNSTFSNLVATGSAAMYIDGRESEVFNLAVDNCTFEGNLTTSGAGGAVRGFSANMSFTNTSFTSNTSTEGSGGALFANGESDVSITDCQFVGNETVGAGWGGSSALYGRSVNIQRCSYRNNAAGRSGGAIIIGFQNNATIDSCEFRNNAASFGGALFVQNDSTRLQITRATFADNSAENNGGAISATGGLLGSIDNATFLDNSADFGGALAMTGDSAEIDQISLTNLEFRRNEAMNQGGAMNFGNVNDLLLENILAVENIAFGNGIGGLLSNNATDNSVSTIMMRNVTTASNIATVTDLGGGAIMQWEEDETAQATITMQNVLLYEEIENYKIEQGTPTVISMGGNITTDETLATAHTEPSDQTVNTSGDMFTDLNAGDFTLAAGSPAIDGGVDNGMLPATDLAGNPRVQGDAVDVGAYEALPVGTYDPELAEQFSVAPNPTADVVTVTVAAEWTGRGQWRVYDNRGQLLRSVPFTKPIGTTTQQLDLSPFSAGSYHIVLQLADRYASRTVLKR